MYKTINCSCEAPFNGVSGSCSCGLSYWEPGEFKPLEKFAFVTRHAVTEEQKALAAEKGIELVPVGDIDAFSCEIPEGFDGIVCVHPAMALRALKAGLTVAVFENGNRASESEKPSFFAKALWVYRPNHNYEAEYLEADRLLQQQGM